VILEPSDEGGDTREAALDNIREAVALYLEPVEDDMRFGKQAEMLEKE